MRTGLIDRGLDILFYSGHGSVTEIVTNLRFFRSLVACALRQRYRRGAGNFADITIFDPQTVNDVAAFEDPHHSSAGIEYVIVNGVVSLEHAKSPDSLAATRFVGRDTPKRVSLK